MYHLSRYSTNQLTNQFQNGVTSIQRSCQNETLYITHPRCTKWLHFVQCDSSGGEFANLISFHGTHPYLKDCLSLLHSHCHATKDYYPIRDMGKGIVLSRTWHIKKSIETLPLKLIGLKAGWCVMLMSRW